MKPSAIKDLTEVQALLAINSLLILVVLFLSLLAINQWRQDWLLIHQPIKINTNMQVKLTTNSEKTLADAHLFGNAAEVNNMPISNLQLRVLGISKMMQRQGESKVLLSIAGNPAKVFKVGDHLPYGVTVYEITADAVILENGGNLEKVPLPRPILEFKAKHKLEQST